MRREKHIRPNLLMGQLPWKSDPTCLASLLFNLQLFIAQHAQL